MSANTINRHRFIIDRIRRSPCTRDELVRALEGSHSVHRSVRTVQRDIEHIRHTYGLSIVYSRTTKNYHIEDSDTNASKVVRFLGEASLLPSLRQLMPDDITQHGKWDGWKFVQFEESEAHQSTQLFPELLSAIIQRKVLKITYNPGFEGRKDYEVRPLLLKEYQHRWYLGCRKSGDDAFRSFALDRIIEAHVTSKTFKSRAQDGPSNYYQDVIGISHDPDSPNAQIVKIACSTIEANYMRSSPWHPSQIEVGVDATTGEYVFSLFVEINYELVQTILHHRDKVRVVSPESLREELRSTLASMLDSYGKHKG
jgi:proteasome accessory factor B